MEYTGSNTSNRYWNFTDERGSVVTQSNASGTGQFANSYDAYGVEGSSNSGHYGYAGQMRLDGTGLTHNRNRVYNADLGRFMTTDPIGQRGGLNLYGYVGGDPVNAVDPLGLAPVTYDHCENAGTDEDSRSVLICWNKWGNSLSGDALKQWLQDGRDPNGFPDNFGPWNADQREGDAYRTMFGPLMDPAARCDAVAEAAVAASDAAESININNGVVYVEAGLSGAFAIAVEAGLGGWSEVGGDRWGYYHSVGAGAGASIGAGVVLVG